MTLSALIHKGGLARAATATLATTATHEANKSVTVAPVANVAVAKGTEQVTALLPIVEEKIRLWLAHVGERDPAIITEVLNSCRNDLGTHQYYLKRSEEVPKAITRNIPVTCGSCIQFERSEHHHLGHCSKGEPEAIAGLWDTEQRHCMWHHPKPMAQVKNED